MSGTTRPGRSDAIQAYWLDYQRSRGIQVAGFSATAFAPARHVADDLALRVAAGVKRAQATLRRDFEHDLEPLPQPGEHVVVLDGDGEPRAIVRLRHVELRYFDDIDEDFAAEAGEGDGSLGWWQAAYRQEYAERGEREGFEADGRLALVLEYFDKVWPPSAAEADA